MKNYFQIKISVAFPEEQEMLIAALSEINFYAFEEEKDYLNAYIKEENFKEEQLKEILKGQFDFAKTIIKEENWNTQWENSIEPVIINDFAAIRPSFHEPVKGVKHDLVITPKMSFGTGHHATTFLMIELMEKIDFSNKTVLDFGTGTGVLAILAEKLGAKEIIAIDNDEWSIRNATENIQANHCDGIKIELKQDLNSLPSFDIILANINLNIISHESSAMARLLKTGGILLVSGFLEKDEIEILNIFTAKNFIKKESFRRGDWVATCLEKQAEKL
jgi:ribosomal protein L11 methyltransferase